MTKLYRNITSRELTQLAAFAAEHGNDWKYQLVVSSWNRGLPASTHLGDKSAYTELQALRHSHGYEWLKHFQFPTETD